MSQPGSRSRLSCRSRLHDCDGAAAVEFALVFLIFFTLFYGIVAYGLAFTIKQTLTMAAEEGARAAVQNAPNVATRLARANETASGLLSWLPAAGVTVNTAAVACVVNPASSCVTVTVSYKYAGYPIVTVLPLLGIAIPATLSANATVQFSPT